MTPETELTTPSGQADELPPGPPLYLKPFAIGSIVIGVVLAYLNFKAVSWTFWAVGGGGNTPDRILIALMLDMLIYLVVGLLFVCGGLLLAFSLRSGRVFTMLAAVLCTIGNFLSSIAESMMGAAMKNKEVGSTRMGPAGYDFGGSWGLWATTMLFAIFVLVVFLLPGVRDWLKARPQLTTEN